jgi:hypothetical protein
MSLKYKNGPDLSLTIVWRKTYLSLLGGARPIPSEAFEPYYREMVLLGGIIPSSG